MIFLKNNNNILFFLFHCFENVRKFRWIGESVDLRKTDPLAVYKGLIDLIILIPCEKYGNCSDDVGNTVPLLQSLQIQSAVRMPFWEFKAKVRCPARRWLSLLCITSTYNGMAIPAPLGTSHYWLSGVIDSEHTYGRCVILLWLLLASHLRIMDTKPS